MKPYNVWLGEKYFGLLCKDKATNMLCYKLLNYPQEDTILLEEIENLEIETNMQRLKKWWLEIGQDLPIASLGVPIGDLVKPLTRFFMKGDKVYVQE